MIEGLEERRLLSVSVTGKDISPYETVSFSGTVATFTDTDPSAAEDYAANVNWGDGTIDIALPVSTASGGYTVSGTHTYAEDGQYTLTTSVFENNGADQDTGTATSTASVQEANFTLISGASINAVEATNVNAIVATFKDPGTTDGVDAFTATINWGDSTSSAGTISGSNGNFTIAGSHTYTDELNSSYQVTVTEPAANFTIGPIGAPVSITEGDAFTGAGATISANQGSSFTGAVATFSDTDKATTASDLAATIDWGDGTTTAGTVSGDTGSFTVSGTHAYANHGSFTTKTILVDDAPGTATGTASGSASVIAGETDFVITSGGTITAMEGQSHDFVLATFSDVDGVNEKLSDFTASIDWGDGTTSAGAITGSGTFTVSGSHAYTDELNGSYTVSVSEPEENFTTSVSGAVSVTEGDSGTLIPMTIAPTEGQPFTGAVAKFSDEGNPLQVPGDFTASIDWSDGATTTGTVSGNTGGPFTIAGTHTYTEEGSFTVIASFSDDPPGILSNINITSTANVSEGDFLSSGSNVAVTTEGSTLSGAVAIFNDTNPTATASDFSALIDFGDGTSEAGTVSGGHGSFTVSGGSSHVFDEEGSYQISVTLAEDAPGTASLTAKTTVIVNDAPLTAIPVMVSGTKGSTLSGVVGKFTDADPNGEVGDYIATIDWGDQTASAGVVQSDGAGGFQVVGSHTYDNHGDYNLIISVHDAATGTAIHSTAQIADLGSLSGFTFDDTNLNGQYDTGERKTSGKTVFLDTNDDGILDNGEQSTVTDANGNYTFTSLPAGNYQVRRIFPPGWTYSTAPIDVTLSAGQNLTDLAIGSRATTGSLSGFTFDDTNNDGQYESGENKTSGKTVFLDTNNDGVLDDGERSTVTDSNGNYSFTNLPAGTYHVRRVFPNGWTYSTAPIDVTLAGGQNLNDLAIGSKAVSSSPTGSISGFAFNDLNHDGQFDSNDEKTGGKTIFLDTNNDGALDNDEQSMVTDSSGNFSFTGLDAGTYHVRRVFPHGYTYSTTPIDVDLQPGQMFTNAAIGSEPIS